MFIPPWASARGVPPEINAAWIKATAGMALTVLTTGAYLEGGRLQDQATAIETKPVSEVRAAHPALAGAFSAANRSRAQERCYWLNTPTSECADTQQVRLVAEDLRQRGALCNLGGLVVGLAAIGTLAASLRGLKTP